MAPKKPVPSLAAHHPLAVAERLVYELPPRVRRVRALDVQILVRVEHAPLVVDVPHVRRPLPRLRRRRPAAQRPCEHRVFGRVSGPLSSCRGAQAALKIYLTYR